MTKEKTIQAEVGSYISRLLRDHFGKGPTSVFVTIQQPFVAIHLRGFLAPTEKILHKQKEDRRIVETRDLLMNELRSQILIELWKLAKLDAKEVYADWNLDRQTGLILAVLDDEEPQNGAAWPEGISRQAFQSEIIEASIRAQKKPGHMETYWLNDRTVLVRRTDILIGIEKELILQGFTEELKLCKRPLERHVLAQVRLEAVLKRKILEMFVDWNFEKDIGYAVFILEEEK